MWMNITNRNNRIILNLKFQIYKEIKKKRILKNNKCYFKNKKLKKFKSK